MTEDKGNDARRHTSRWSFAHIRTTDADQAVHEISAVFSNHQLAVLGPSEQLKVQLHARTTGLLTVADISHGTEVLVHPGELRSYYEINIPITGGTTSHCGTDEVESTPQRAAIFTPHKESRMRWSADCRQLAVKVGKDVLDSTLENLLGHPPDEIPEFPMGFDITTQPGRSWLKAVLLLRESIDNDAPDFVLRPLEDLVVGQLLAAQPNNFTGRLTGDPRPPRPRTIARVIDFIEAEPGAAHTASGLAAVAGTSVRSLQAAFADHLGLTPMEYVRRVRLARCRQAFLTANPSDRQTVADIAFQNGFAHLPRFAAAYRKLYHESPSDTLRRRRC